MIYPVVKLKLPNASLSSAAATLLNLCSGIGDFIFYLPQSGLCYACVARGVSYDSGAAAGSGETMSAN